MPRAAAEERNEAKGLFQSRLDLDARRQLDDLRGTAMAVAGLGRLELIAEPKDVAAAEKRFQRNLEISEAIGDMIAQVKMRSLLGACALEKGDLDPALTHYQRSWELAGDRIDRCYAAVGLLRCYQRQNCPDLFDGMAQQLLDLLQEEEIPADCESQLRAALNAVPAGSRGPAASKLLALLIRQPSEPLLFVRILRIVHIVRFVAQSCGLQPSNVFVLRPFPYIHFHGIADTTASTPLCDQLCPRRVFPIFRTTVATRTPTKPR